MTLTVQVIATQWALTPEAIAALVGFTAILGFLWRPMRAVIRIEAKVEEHDKILISLSAKTDQLKPNGGSTLNDAIRRLEVDSVKTSERLTEQMRRVDQMHTANQESRFTSEAMSQATISGIVSAVVNALTEHQEKS